MRSIINQFSLKTKVVFNQGSLAEVKNLAGTKALIISDKILEKLGYAKIIEDYLADAGLKSTVFTEVKPDPDTKVITDGLKILQEIQPDVLIAIGGGSAIDAAKGILYSAKQMIGESFKRPYFVTIPSTSGTGSEVTDFSVITAEGDKVVLVNEYMAADLAILDSTCISNVPKNVVIDTGIDVLTHATEAYVANMASDFTDALVEKVIKMMFKHLPIVAEDAKNDISRDCVHNASCLAGIAFNNAGLGINHSLAHAIGGRFHLPHGRCNALLLEEVIAFNAELSGAANNAAAKKYAQLAAELGLPARTAREGVVSYIDAIKKLKKTLGVENGFSELGINKEEYMEALDKMAETALIDRCTPANPREAVKEELKAIYQSVY